MRSGGDERAQGTILHKEGATADPLRSSSRARFRALDAAAKRAHLALQVPALWEHLRDEHRLPEGPERRQWIPNGYGYEYRQWHAAIHYEEVLP